jgi:hypothetical protein
LNSREELKVVEQDLEELENKRKNTLKEFDESKRKTKKLRDIASKRLTNTEQKEILSLLLKNFEFEIRNIEMQADIFKRDFKLREQDMVILRLEQHRSLCDTLIFQQKRLIDENKIKLPHDLSELYYLYSRDVNDGQLMKDLSSTRLTPNLVITNVSPKPNVNAFLTQIEEENVEHKNSLSSYDDDTSKIDDFLTSYNSSSSNKNIDYLEPNKVFHKTNKLKNNNNTLKSNINNKKSKDSNYHLMNNNYISSNGTGGLQTTSIVPHIAYNNKDKNNISMLSSSTNDSNMEIILENVPAITNKQLIKAAPRATNKYNANNGHYYFNNNITVPPGQIIPYTNVNINNNGNKGETSAKRLTQGIVAIAAQRKASQHHRQLMQELYDDNRDYQDNDKILTTSRLANHDQINGSKTKYSNEMNELNEKKNSLLTDGSINNNGNNTKAKKQVKIQEIVQFKLPDDDIDAINEYTNENSNEIINASSLKNKSKKGYKNSKTRSKCIFFIFFNHFSIN